MSDRPARQRRLDRAGVEALRHGHDAHARGVPRRRPRSAGAARPPAPTTTSGGGAGGQDPARRAAIIATVSRRARRTSAWRASSPRARCEKYPPRHAVQTSASTDDGHPGPARAATHRGGQVERGLPPRRPAPHLGPDARGHRVEVVGRELVAAGADGGPEPGDHGGGARGRAWRRRPGPRRPATEPRHPTCTAAKTPSGDPSATGAQSAVRTAEHDARPTCHHGVGLGGPAGTDAHGTVPSGTGAVDHHDRRRRGPGVAVDGAGPAGHRGGGQAVAPTSRWSPSSRPDHQALTGVARQARAERR